MQCYLTKIYLYMNATKPKISIVIPFYNVAPYFLDCLRSIANQDYDGEVECLLVDDRGQDESAQIAIDFMNEYEGPISFRIVIREENGGLSAARNSGMDCATGEYIMFVDSDDEISPDCLSKLVRPLLTERYDCVMGKYDTLPIVHTNPADTLHEGVLLREREIFEAKRDGKISIAAWNKLYRRDFLRIKDLRFMEGILWEDTPWTIEFCLLAKSMYIIEDVTYFYRKRCGSITTASWDLDVLIDNHLQISKEIRHFMRLRDVENCDFVFDYLSRLLFVKMATSAINKEPKPQRKQYVVVRKAMKPSWWKAFKANGRNIKSQIVDFHLFFPPFLGYHVVMFLRYLLWLAVIKFGFMGIVVKNSRTYYNMNSSPSY